LSYCVTPDDRSGNKLVDELERIAFTGHNGRSLSTNPRRLLNL